MRNWLVLVEIDRRMLQRLETAPGFGMVSGMPPVAGIRTGAGACSRGADCTPRSASGPTLQDSRQADIRDVGDPGWLDARQHRHAPFMIDLPACMAQRQRPPGAGVPSHPGTLALLGWRKRRTRGD